MNPYRGVVCLSSPFVSRRLLRSGTGAVVVFNYHDISDRPSQFCREFNLNVSPRVFVAQLRWIRKYFNVITPHELLSGDFETPAALITFDDGMKSVFSVAAAILAAEGLAATVFMNMGVLDDEPFWAGLVIYLSRYNASFRQFVERKFARAVWPSFFLDCTRADVEEFCASHRCDDLFGEVARYSGEFGCREDLASSAAAGLYLANHLYNHYNAASLTPADLREQYLRNDRALAQYPNNVPFFSYPFGQPGRCYNQATDTLLESLGAARLFTAFALPNRTKAAHKLHRISMFDYVNDERRFRANCLVPTLLNDIVLRRRVSCV